MNLQLCARCLPFSSRSALLGIPVSNDAIHLPFRGRILIMRSQCTHLAVLGTFYISS
jgi:hypothetical protein